jgi:hypothetical protein
MHKLSTEAIFLQHVMYFGVTDGCGIKIVSSFRDMWKRKNQLDVT